MARTRRILRNIALTALGLVVLAGGYLVWEIGPRNLWGMLLYDQREEGLLATGDLAPDVVLLDLDGELAHLHEHTGRGKPTVIIFGSYT